MPPSEVLTIDLLHPPAGVCHLRLPYCIAPAKQSPVPHVDLPTVGPSSDIILSTLQPFRHFPVYHVAILGYIDSGLQEFIQRLFPIGFQPLHPSSPCPRHNRLMHSAAARII